MSSVVEQLTQRVQEAQDRVAFCEQRLKDFPDSWEHTKNLEYALRLLSIWEERVADGK